jgi:hypothetical protein
MSVTWRPMMPYVELGLSGDYGSWLKCIVGCIMQVTIGHTLANNKHTSTGLVISAISMEEFLHKEDFRVTKSQAGVNVSVLGILEKALDYV